MQIFSRLSDEIFSRINMKDGTFEMLQQLQLSSTDGDYGAEILFNEAGDRLYASSRGTGVILVYNVTQVEQVATVTRVQELSQSGTWPRHMSLERRIMVTSDQRGDTVQVLHVESGTGLLTPGKIIQTEKSPAFVKFLK